MGADETLIFNYLPSDEITIKVKYEDNILFQHLGDKIVFSQMAFRDFNTNNNFSLIKYLISFYNGVNNSINNRKDTILTQLLKYSKITL